MLTTHKKSYLWREQHCPLRTGGVGRYRTTHLNDILTGVLQSIDRRIRSLHTGRTPSAQRRIGLPIIAEQADGWSVSALLMQTQPTLFYGWSGVNRPPVRLHLTYLIKPTDGKRIPMSIFSGLEWIATGVNGHMFLYIHCSIEG